MRDRPESKPGSERRPRGPRGGGALLLFAGILVAAVLFYHEVLGYALLGHDSYPILRAARIEGAGDFAGTFTEELMDGAYPEGRFYRPVLNLSFALDHALYGLRPWGFHLTDLLLASLAALLAAILAAPPATPRGAPTGPLRIAPVAAALLFLAHPVHLNVLPVAARRGDALALVFTALALAWSARRPSSRAGPALFALLAVGSKESGAIAPILLFLRALVSPIENEEEVEVAPARAAGSRGRLSAALRVSIPAAIVVLLFFAARFTVIEEIGGHRPLTAEALFRTGPAVFLWILRFTASPFLTFGPLLGSRGAALLFFALLAAGTSLALRGKRERAVAIVAWAWLLLGAAIHAPSLAVSPWYALHTAFPLAVLSGVVGEAAIRALRTSRRFAGRIAAGGVLLGLLWPAALHVRGTPLFTFYPEWKDASRRTSRYLGDLEKELRAAAAGSRIDAPGLPYLSRRRAGSPILTVASLSDYTVQAWADLVFPGRKIRVARPDPPPAPPAPGEVLVVVSPGR